MKVSQCDPVPQDRVRVGLRLMSQDRRDTPAEVCVSLLTWRVMRSFHLTDSLELMRNKFPPPFSGTDYSLHWPFVHC